MKSLPSPDQFIALAFATLLTLLPETGPAQSVPHPVLYVTQVPTWKVSGTVTSLAGSHLASSEAAPRGGDLMIRYADGSTKNLTRAAGYGVTGMQAGANAIAVRDPSVHWNGERALFSMVVGAPDAPGEARVFFWQIHEISGLGRNETPVVTRVAGQAADFNNIQPTYTSGERILFVSDRTLDGTRTLYPTRDERGTEQSVTGLWALDPGTSRLTLVDHSPSGSFKPFVDGFGRVVFSRWDHLQRDAFAPDHRAIDYESESPAAATTTSWSDIFPETTTPSGTATGHTFDQFLPWIVNQDGSGLLTINHLGRHELGLAFPRSRTDSNLVDFTITDTGTQRVGDPTRAGSYLQITENRAAPGTYMATDAVSTAVSAGRFVTFTAPPSTNGDGVVPRIATNTGLARDAAFLADGRIMGSFTTGPTITGSYYGTETPGPISSDFIPTSPFRIVINRNVSSTRLDEGIPLTTGATASVINITLNGTRNYSGPLWELQPTEVTARPVPPFSAASIDPVEAAVFSELRVSVSRFQSWLEKKGMALLVSRNVTARDHRDRQQPYNLYVPGGVASIADAGPVYPVSTVQFFQGDYVRAYADASGMVDTAMGRRLTARILHATRSENPPSPIEGSTSVAPDGSIAMLVPAERALTWQVTDPEGNGIVRERYWLSFKAGEIRTCANCHGNSTADQLGRPPVSNPPQALRVLLTEFLQRHPDENLVVSAYEQWAESAIARDAPPSGDHDLDGLTNLEEFTYGTDPNRPDAMDPSHAAIPLRAGIHDSEGENHARLHFTRRTGPSGPRVSVESSTNLSDWVSVALISSEGVQTPGPVTVTRNETSPSSATGLERIEVSFTEPLSGIPTHYRLRLESR